MKLLLKMYDNYYVADKVLNENTTLINDIDWILDDGVLEDI